jgi:hypothetical protein
LVSPLQGLRIGISGAIPDRGEWGPVADLDQRILRFVSQLGGLLMKYGAHVVHGNHPSFTPVLTQLARRFARSEAAPLTLLSSGFFPDTDKTVERARDVARVVVTPAIATADATAAPSRSLSLTALRLELAREIDALVAIGGRLHTGSNVHPGVLEELTLARWQGVPCFVVGAVGGFAATIDHHLLRSFSIDNCLPDSDVDRLADPGEDLDVTAGRLLEHFFATPPRAAREANAVPQPSGAYVATIDVTEVRAAAARFDEVRAAFDRGDTNRVDFLLSPHRVP